MAMIDHLSSNCHDEKFYTQCFRRGLNLYIQGYIDGKRWRHVVKPYSPTLYVTAPQSAEATYASLDTGEGLVPKRFADIHQAQDFVEQFKAVENCNVYGSTDWVGQYLCEVFPDEIHYDPHRIKVAFIDIETDTAGGFSSVADAMQPVIAITVGVNGEHYTLGLVDFKIPEGRRDIHYRKCKNEQELLGCFIRLWRDIDPDVVSGYNINNYDLPYLAKRLGDYSVYLSSWKMEPEFLPVLGKGGRETLRPMIRGISSLDYYDLYTNGKFIQGEREEYTLDYISHYELGANKVDYSEYGSLERLYTNNPQKFIEYNIRDVELVEKLDAKLGFIDLVYVMAYGAKVNYDDTLGTVKIWETIARNHLLEKHIVPSLKPSIPDDNAPSIKGGYVKDPKAGLYQWVISFDASSLYPSLIRQLNISPETLVGIEYKNGAAIIGSQTWLKQLDVAKENNWTIASNGAAFKRDKLGFLPELMDKYYQSKRKDSMLLVELEREFEANKDSKLQHQIDLTKSRIFATKILLNSLYGATANRYFQYYDNRIAEAITLSGQSLITYTATRINQWMSDTLKHESDYIVASDTDSVMVDCSAMVRTAQRMGSLAPDADTPTIVGWLDRLCESVLNPLLDEIMKDVAAFQNAPENVVKMVREGISDAALWTAAKNYVMRVCNNKGVMFSTPRYKIKGLEAIRSSTPTKCREKLKAAIPLVLDRNQAGLKMFIEEFCDEYPKLPLSEISKNISLRFSTKVITQQMRAAAVYNKMLESLDLADKYDRLASGSKLRIVKLKMPNPVNSDIIGFPNGVLPQEFGLAGFIDYNAMFDHYFIVPLEKMARVAQLTVSTEPTLFDLME